MTTNVLGIDGALANTGLVVVQVNHLKLTPLYAGVLTTKPGLKRGERASQEDFRRAIELSRKIDEVIGTYNPKLILLDELTGSQSAKASHALGLAAGAVAVTVWRTGRPYLIIPSRIVRQRLCDNVFASKGDIAAKVRKCLGSAFDACYCNVTPSKHEHMFDAAGLILAAVDEPMWRAVVQGTEQDPI